MGESATVIDRVDIHGYDLTYAHGDYVMSSGRVVNVLPSTVVRIRTRGGIDGFGEACPLGSTYLPGFAEGARAALRELAPALVGVDAANLAAVGRVMDATLRGHEYAKSALDVACWDILGRAANLPVAALLGGALQSEVPLYVAVPLGEPDAMDHINLKVGRVGGLTKARLIRDAAVELGLRLTIEDSWGGDIVTAAVSHLAAGVPAASLFAASFMNDWTLEHIAGHQPRSRDGLGLVPSGPGLGIEVDVDRLGAPLFSAPAG